MTEIEHEVVRLVCNAEYKPVWEPVVLDELGPDQVRVHSELTSAKHGTELSFITGGAIYQSSPYLSKEKVFDRTRSTPADPKAFSATGQTTVGTVTAVGRDVKHLKEGERVWGGGRFQTVQQGAGFRQLVDGLTPEAACCIDPAKFALAAVRDGKIRVGDNVIVFGMGAIGLFAAQLARLSGALNVVAVDPLASRRALALRHGATQAVDPNDVGDFAAASRQWFADGADVTIEASASYGALNQAIRATRYNGTVSVLSFYKGEARGLYLGEEFHFNQLNLICARAVSDPQREYSWTHDRLEETLIGMFSSGTLVPHGLPAPIVSVDELPATYAKILHAPDEVIKVAVRY
jgi:threonine dehydrogenase-like Zn-dependent dehydrogenase